MDRGLYVAGTGAKPPHIEITDILTSTPPRPLAYNERYHTLIHEIWHLYCDQISGNLLNQNQEANLRLLKSTVRALDCFGQVLEDHQRLSRERRRLQDFQPSADLRSYDDRLRVTEYFTEDEEWIARLYTYRIVCPAANDASLRKEIFERIDNGFGHTFQLSQTEVEKLFRILDRVLRP